MSPLSPFPCPLLAPLSACRRPFLGFRPFLCVSPFVVCVWRLLSPLPVTFPFPIPTCPCLGPSLSPLVLFRVVLLFSLSVRCLPVALSSSPLWLAGLSAASSLRSSGSSGPSSGPAVPSPPCAASLRSPLLRRSPLLLSPLPLPSILCLCLILSAAPPSPLVSSTSWRVEDSACHLSRSV